MQPAPEAEDDDEQRLDAMDKEGKKGGIGRGNAVEHHHGDDGKMPRPGSVGGRNDDGNTTHHEQYHAGSPAQSGREVDAVERQIEVQEVACPDGYGIEKVQHRMFDIADGQAAQPDVFQHAPHFRKNGEIAYQPAQ